MGRLWADAESSPAGTAGSEPAAIESREHPEVRERLEAAERRLSAFAARSQESAGRAVQEPPDPMRTAFQRDRDRILHSKAFRRLKHKTQVFIAPRGDHYRTRLTHTLEVMQVARSITRALNLNEDLAEAIAVGHDLGHTPFGHAGEEILASLLPQGFRHNEQSLRVVEALEKGGRGLNLTSEVKDGILKHSKVREDIAAEAWGIPSTLEGQVVKLSDSLAYLAHDLDDAVRAGMLRADLLPKRFTSALGARSSRMIDTMIRDVVDHNWHLAEAGSGRWQDVVANGIVIAPSLAMLQVLNELREFMFLSVYRDSEAQHDVPKARFVLESLFRHFLAHRDELPVELRANPRQEPAERVVADHLAGMTDRFALCEFERLFMPKEWIGLA